MLGSTSPGALFVVAGSAVVGAVHALLPDHWIPYVVLSKARGWDLPRSLASVVAGGVAHLVSTTVLGVLIAYLGAEALAKAGPVAELAGAGLLVVFGGVLSLRGLAAARRGEGHLHGHAHGREGHTHGSAPPRRDRGYLLQGALLGIRPCAEAIPVFLAASVYGLTSSLLAVLAWVAATLGTMVTIVWVSLTGLRGVNPDFLSRYGDLVAGLVILVMGLGAVVLTALV